MKYSMSKSNISVSVDMSQSDMRDAYVAIPKRVDKFPHIKCVQKNIGLNVCFAHISVSVYWILKIVMLTPHNIPLIMWGMHKNLKDLMYRS